MGGESYPVANFWLFGVSPILLLVALWCVSYLLLLLVNLLFPFPKFNEENFTRAALLALATLFNTLMVIIPSVLGSILYCRLARKYGIGKRWMLLSCIVLGGVAALYCFSISPYGPPGHYYMHDGIRFCSPIQFVHFSVPLGIGWWFMRRTPAHGRPQLAA